MYPHKLSNLIVKELRNFTLQQAGYYNNVLNIKTITKFKNFLLLQVKTPTCFPVSRQEDAYYRDTAPTVNTYLSLI